MRTVHGVQKCKSTTVVNLPNISIRLPFDVLQYIECHKIKEGERGRECDISEYLDDHLLDMGLEQSLKQCGTLSAAISKTIEYSVLHRRTNPRRNELRVEEYMREAKATLYKLHIANKNSYPIEIEEWEFMFTLAGNSLTSDSLGAISDASIAESIKAFGLFMRLRDTFVNTPSRDIEYYVRCLMGESPCQTVSIEMATEHFIDRLTTSGIDKTQAPRVGRLLSTFLEYESYHVPHKPIHETFSPYFGSLHELATLGQEC